MSIVPTKKDVLDKRLVTVVLRLVISEQGTVAYGELVDVNGNSIDRYMGEREMTRALCNWVASLKRNVE